MTDTGTPRSPAPTEGAGAPPPALLRALRHLLRPLVRLLLEHQITYPALSRLLKAVYVEEAARAFALPGKRQTVSRLSLLTGIHRKDVKRLREAPPPPDAPPPAVSLGAELVARWLGTPRYLDDQGQPLPLPRQATEGGGPSFEELVESRSKDIRARAVLDEWLRLGIAHLDGRDRVCLNAEAFVPREGFEEKAYYLGRHVHDHLAAAAHNLRGGDRPLLERSAYYAPLTESSAAELRELAEAAATSALQRVNRRAMALRARDQGRPDARLRFRFGVYVFSGPGEEEDEARPAEGKDDGAS